MLPNRFKDASSKLQDNVIKLSGFHPFRWRTQGDKETLSG